MALVREPMVYVDGYDAEVSAFDALGYGYGYHDALLGGGGIDVAALFGGYASAELVAPCGASNAYVPDSMNWAAGAGSSVLAFDMAARGRGAAQVAVSEEEDCDAWIDAMDENQSHDGAATLHHAAMAMTASIGYDAVSGCFSLTERPSGAGRPFGLLFPSTSSGSPDDGATAPGRASRKRTYVERTSGRACMEGAEPQAISPTTSTKKQCGASRKTTGKAKPAPTAPPKDPPQSLAAKNRRERISERLRTLQELVPNGTKVDMVTMLEKAISYVKFLQLQVKVLAADEFWPAQEGTAPEISQVKDALDAILSLSSSTQREQMN